MSNLQQLEQQAENAKQLIAVRDMALRLAQNPDFRKLILDEFMVKEAARYVQASIDPSLSPTERADSLLFAQSTGALKRWLSVQVQMGNTAANERESLEAAIAEARAEEDEVQE